MYKLSVFTYHNQDIVRPDGEVTTHVSKQPFYSRELDYYTDAFRESAFIARLRPDLKLYCQLWKEEYRNVRLVEDWDENENGAFGPQLEDIELVLG